MYFKFVYDESLSQASFIIGCQKEGIAAVIDPKRDVDDYLKIAKENNLKITHILETHIHADFLCGSRELAALTGADLYLSDEGDKEWKYQFPHIGLTEGSQIQLGNVLIEVLHTPGHTPEHLSFLVTDKAACEEPVMLFTGDFVFVGDIGRPDLLDKLAGDKKSAKTGAIQQFTSLKKLLGQKDYIQIWPGHGAGSSCGKSIGAVPMTTLGYEKKRNWAMQFENDKDAFVKELLTNQPEPPRYYSMMKKLNKEDRSLLTEVPKAKNLSEKAYRQAIEKGMQVVDARAWTEYAKGHIRKAWNITNDHSFSTEMGWYMSYDKPLLIIAQKTEMEEITRKLMRIGMDHMHGYITPSQFKKWEKEKLISAKIVDKKTLQKELNNPEIQLIDVRSKKEYNEGHIDNAKNIFFGTIDENLTLIPKNKQVIVYCQTGGRAAAAYSMLVSKGLENVFIYPGGWQEWSEK